MDDGTLSEGMGSQKVEEPHGADLVDEGPQEDERGKTLFTFPVYDPLSSFSTSSRDGAWLKVCRQAHLRFQLEIRKLWIETDKEKS